MEGQGRHYNKRVEVIFNRDIRNPLKGTVINDTAESRLIKLDSGRVVNFYECQFRYLDEPDSLNNCEVCSQTEENCNC